MADHGEFREELHGEHPHSYDHREPQYIVIGVLAGLTALFVVLIGIAIQYYYEFFHERQTYQKVLSQENWDLQNLRNKERWELTNYGYMDKAKGLVRIPIDQAMQMVVQEAAEGRTKYPTSPYRVKTPAELAGQVPPVSQPGAAAANAAQNQGVTSSPNVQGNPAPQQTTK